MSNFGTYKNQYGKTVTDRGPSQGQIDLIIKLVAEKVVPNDYIAGLIEDFNADALSGQQAKSLIDTLIAAKSQIVAPSTLSRDGERKPASEKQLHWIAKLLAEKVVPENEAALITGWVNEGFPGRNAGRVMDYLFDLPAANAPEPTQGFLGEIGLKLTVTGTVTTFREIDGKFGLTNLVVVTTEAGQAVKAFTASKTFGGVAEGQVITVTGTVKSHDIFKGAEATLLGRMTKVANAAKALGMDDADTAAVLAHLDTAPSKADADAKVAAVLAEIEEKQATPAAADDAAVAPTDTLSYWGLGNLGN